MASVEVSPADSGFVKVCGFNIYYESHGDSDNVMLCLHGGPGATHGYLTSLSKIAGPDLRVVMYDQLACGRSERTSDLSLFNIERAAEEIENLRTQLNLGEINLLGQSYGGFLTLQYALKHQQHIRKLILSNTAASIPRTVEEMQRLRAQLPAESRTILDKYEALGDLQNPEYLSAMMLLYKRHLCLVDPWPPLVEQIFSTLNTDIYWHMWGPNEFNVTGNLRYWNVVPRLSTIKCPTLIITGEHDELTPDLSLEMQKEISDSKLVIFRGGSHLLMFEQEQKYLSVISEFLRGKDRESPEVDWI